MKITIAILLAASLAFVGCKKKENKEAPATGSGSAAAPAGSAAAPAAPAGVKSCAELGGTPDSSRPDTCMLKATTQAPFTATWTGKYDTTAMRPDNPGALFKVTNNLGAPVRISNASLYAYDKSGKQVDLTGKDGSKSKYAQDSQMSLIEIDAGATKDFVHSVGKDMLPADVDALQLEFTAWETQDGKAKFVRNLETGQDEVRPKDGWK